MATFLKLKPSYLKLRSLLLHQRFCHTTVFEGGSEADLFAELGSNSMAASGDINTSKWKKMDARSLGLTLSMIPYASRTIIKILQSEGHDAFLVGGCVRDLLLNRIPKDFDVITTANLKQIRNKFYHAYVIGRRFPICMVHVKGSAVEVSSFNTLANEKEEEVHLSELPKGCDEKDFIRWKNSLNRDFTVNSLFYDPFANKIYDYSDGMTDLKAMKMRTLVPAHSSFQDDCARILRGLRIAARLGFSFAKDTEKAIQNLYASVKTLNKARLMMEMNYMLSYGASHSTLLLLKKFKLLEILLPFHAAYLADNSFGQSSPMFLELFSKLDGVVSCDQPCDSVLWASLLVFHIALVNNPQDAIVIWTLSSLLYHGTWEEGVKTARKHSNQHVNFSPEICNTYDNLSDDELAQRISHFASNILESIVALTDSESLHKFMHNYSSCPISNVVCVSKNTGRSIADIFNMLVYDIKSINKSRENYAIDYELLKIGDKSETRYVLGKVIIDTMRAGITQQRPKLLSEKKRNFHSSKVEQVELSKNPHAKDFKHETNNHKSGEKHKLEGLDDQMNQQTNETRKLVEEKLSEFLSFHSGANKKQSIKKGVVRETNVKQDAKRKISLSDVQIPNKSIPNILKDIPSAKILHVLGSLPKRGDIHNNQALEEANVSKSLIRHKTQASTKMPNVYFKEDEDRKNYSEQERGAVGRNESRKKNKKMKLSSIFK